MISTITVLWILLANGNVVTREFPTFADCQRTQQVLLADAAIRGDARFSRLLCIEETVPSAGVQ